MQTRLMIGQEGWYYFYSYLIYRDYAFYNSPIYTAKVA